MRTILSTIGTLSLLLASTPAFAADIQRLDKLTNATDRYISGEMESRLVELGTEKTTGVSKPLWRQTAEEGLQRHCAAVLRARGQSTEGTPCHNAK